jgi:curved DNA-binding protein CbpA
MHKYYAILGLKYGASASEIKKAYYRLSKEIHPDINSSESAIEEFVRINEAYEILLKIRKPTYKVTFKKKKRVNKEWLAREKKIARYKTAKKLKQKRDAYLKSVKQETYSTNV